MYAAAPNGVQQTALSLVNLVIQMKRNFIDRNLELMPGLFWNQYRTLTTIHYYLNSKFEGGDLDENGNDKFFHNIINHRNAHATKNIDLDTKDVNVETDLEDKYWMSWVLRMELQEWMKEYKFGKLLNDLSDELPKYGSVVWKKTLEEDDDGNNSVCIKSVDLRDLILDQSAESMKDSQIVAERLVMTSKQVQDKVEDGWDAAAVKELTRVPNMPIKKDHFIRDRDIENAGAYSLTDVLPQIDVYELWGWIPENFLPLQAMIDMGIDPEKPDPTKFRYIMAVIGGLETGAQNHILYCQEAQEEDFPYKEVHMRKMRGRWLGMGNTELLLPFQVRMNELVNRFFMALRLGSVHLFQTTGKMLQKNLLQDAQDGDIIQSSQPINPIATEIRAFAQYQNEIKNIEARADDICSTPEIVTGESMPAATPFRLGATLGANAAKIFDYMRQNCGMFIADVMYDWVLPNIADNLTEEHTLSLMGSTDELAAFNESYRKSVLYTQLKDFVLNAGRLPTEAEFATAEKALNDQMKSGGDKKLIVKAGFFKAEDMDEARIVCDPTGETENKAAQTETMGNLLQIITSNPAIMQDSNARMIIGRIMENAGISPLRLSGFVSQPAPAQPELPPGASGPNGAPAAPGGAPGAPASPAMAAFGANPGSAGKTAPLPG